MTMYRKWSDSAYRKHRRSTEGICRNQQRDPYRSLFVIDGRKALRCATDFIRTFPCCRADDCVIKKKKKNGMAREFYRSFGFKELNEPGYYEEGDELSAVMKL